MAKFRLVSTGNGDSLPEVSCAIASATVIAPGSLVTLSSGLIIAAVAASTAVGYCENGSRDGETSVNVSVGNDFVLEGTGDAVFAATQKGVAVDITDAQLIDVGTSSTLVVRQDISENAGTVGATTGMRIKINVPLF